MSKDPNLIVTLGGRPVPDQAIGIRAFKDACLAASKTQPPQAGEWTLTAPDGRTWKADSPLKCCGLEQRERVPANVALARIVEEMERFDAEEAAKATSTPETSSTSGTALAQVSETAEAGHSAQETPAEPPRPGCEEWWHLKQYGYAPGGYIITCFDCKETVWNCDKRASICRPCAEKRHSAENRREGR